MRGILVLLLVGWSLLPVAGASAQANLPPDNSGVDEYTENVPDAGGDKPSNQVGGGGGGNGGGDEGASLPPEVSDQFDQAGDDGAAAAALAQATAPDRGDGDRGEAAADERGGDPSGDSGGGGVGEIARVVVGGSSGGSYGMGIVLPIILGLTLLGAVLFLRARRRGPGQPGNA